MASRALPSSATLSVALLALLPNSLGGAAGLVGNGCSKREATASRLAHEQLRFTLPRGRRDSLRSGTRCPRLRVETTPARQSPTRCRGMSVTPPAHSHRGPEEAVPWKLPIRGLSDLPEHTYREQGSPPVSQLRENARRRSSSERIVASGRWMALWYGHRLRCPFLRPAKTVPQFTADALVNCLGSRCLVMSGRSRSAVRK